MKARLRTALYFIARTIGLFRLARFVTRDRLRILAYHGIWIGDDHFGNFLFMRPETFSRRMAKLRRSGYRVVTLDALLEGHDNCSGVPVAITIDDGWLGTFRHMLPVLEENDFPATLYLYSRYVQEQLPVPEVFMGYLFSRAAQAGVNAAPAPCESERLPLAKARLAWSEALNELEDPGEKDALLRRLAEVLGIDDSGIRNEQWLHLMSSEQVAEAAERGLDIQLHTHSHSTTRDGVDVLATEIDRNRAALAAICGTSAQHFCYPSGVCRPENWPVLREHGIVSATTTEQGMGYRNGNRLALPRLMDGEDVSELEFEAELSGFAGFLRPSRRRPDSGAIGGAT